MEANKNKYRRTYYVEGTAARQLEVMPEYEQQEERAARPRVTRKATPKLSHGIDFFSMTLLLTAMVIVLYLCYDYLQVQGNIVQLKRDMVNLSATYNTLASENAALEEGLNTQLNWDQVYLTAVNELGMVYPNKNEVITYTSEEKGYVIQYRSIPE